MAESQQVLLDILYQGLSLSRRETETLFKGLIRGEMSQTAIAAMLIALKSKGETTGEITGAASALRAEAKTFPKKPDPQGVIDIVGTGGDSFNTINISTTAAVVAAECGAKVAKHGNRGISSSAGSSDVLAQLGVNLTMSPEAAADCLDNLGLCFLFAPHYHLGVKHAVPVRQALKTRTIFNIIGPLCNPARPEYMLLGVYDSELLMPMAESLKALNVKRAMVVYGSGMDEIALHNVTEVAELMNGEIRHYQLTPADFGVPSVEINDIEGGNPQENAAITKAILEGKAKSAHRNAVAVNAGCALYLSGISPCVKTGTEKAQESIDSGRGWDLLTQLVAASEEILL